MTATDFGVARALRQFQLTDAGRVDRTEGWLVAVEKRDAFCAGDAPAGLIQAALSGLEQELRIGVQAAGNADEIDFAGGECPLGDVKRPQFARGGHRDGDRRFDRRSEVDEAAGGCLHRRLGDCDGFVRAGADIDEVHSGMLERRGKGTVSASVRPPST